MQSQQWRRLLDGPQLRHGRHGSERHNQPCIIVFLDAIAHVANISLRELSSQALGNAVQASATACLSTLWTRLQK
eukprot:12426364-Karenia_brevis.AAC.1